MLNVKVRVTFIDHLLGLEPSSPDIYAEYVASKSPNDNVEAEMDAMPELTADNKGVTVFHRDENGDPCLHMRHIKGYFKEACRANQIAAGKDANGKKKLTTESSRISAYKSVIDTTIFVTPDFIKITPPEDDTEGMTRNSRPLRCQNAAGVCTAIACSEQMPAYSQIEFVVTLLNPSHRAALEEWLKYGYWHGMGGWRNAGMGRFAYEIIDEYES